MMFFNRLLIGISLKAIVCISKTYSPLSTEHCHLIVAYIFSSYVGNKLLSESLMNSYKLIEII